MEDDFAIELFVADQPGLVEDVEHACGVAASNPGGIAAVAVDSSHVPRAADLLFGTGVGIVSVLDFGPAHLLQRARLSLAAGATELALPHIDLSTAGLSELRFVAGSDVALTVDVTSVNATADLTRAEQALRLGADFVSFNPWESTPGSTAGVEDLVGLVEQLQVGGIKLADEHDGPHASALRSTEWAQAANQPTRLCLPSSEWPR